MNQDLANAAVTMGAFVGIVVGGVALIWFLNGFNRWLDDKFGGFGVPILGLVIMFAFVVFVFWGLLAGGHVQ